MIKFFQIMGKLLETSNDFSSNVVKSPKYQKSYYINRYFETQETPKCHNYLAIFLPNEEFHFFSFDKGTVVKEIKTP